MAKSKPKYESTSETEPKREAREPRALSNEYHKARKQLMLWAGILFIWELVGVDLEKAKEAGGNFGAIIGAIKSPQAVPWALLILVAYFLFKVTVEWYQCNAACRRLRVARVDFGSAWFVSLLAYSLYIGQTISHVQFADLLKDSGNLFSWFTGMLLGWTVSIVAFGLWEDRGKLRRIDFWYSFWLMSIGVGAVIVMWIYLRAMGKNLHWRSLLFGALATIPIGLAREVLSRSPFPGMVFTVVKDFAKKKTRDSAS